MVGSTDAAEAIGETLGDFKGQIIYDPVLKASDGNSLAQPGTLQKLHEHVLSKATVITPNLPELEILTETSCKNHQDAVAKASDLFTKFPRLEAVVLTGGHFPSESKEITDFLLTKLSSTRKKAPKIEKASHQRIKTRNTHGTGCTFSAAFTSYHLKYGDYKKAFVSTVDFMDQLLKKSSVYNLGQGHGGLAHHLFE